MKRLACSAALVTAGCVGVAHSPPLQAGLWEVRVQTVENPAGKKSDFTYKLCRDHAYDKRADAAVRKAKNCQTRVEDLGNGRYSAASRCAADGMLVTSRGLSVYASAAASHSETVATYSPAFYGKTDETMVQDQRFVGACPAGIKPGDRVMGDGRIVRGIP